MEFTYEASKAKGQAREKGSNSKQMSKEQRVEAPERVWITWDDAYPWTTPEMGGDEYVRVQPPTADAGMVAGEIVDYFAAEYSECGCGDFFCEHHRLPMAQRIAAALSAAKQQGAGEQRERDAKAVCELCRRFDDYHPAVNAGENIWEHTRIGYENDWREWCRAAAVRSNQ